MDFHPRRSRELDARVSARSVAATIVLALVLVLPVAHLLAHLERAVLRHRVGPPGCAFSFDGCDVSRYDPRAQGTRGLMRPEADARFWIDPFPVSEEAYLSCAHAGACPPIPRDERAGFLAPARVTVAEATAYCEWLGRRLPTTSEVDAALHELPFASTQTSPRVRKLLVARGEHASPWRAVWARHPARSERSIHRDHWRRNVWFPIQCTESAPKPNHLASLRCALDVKESSP